MRSLTTPFRAIVRFPARSLAPTMALGLVVAGAAMPAAAQTNWANKPTFSNRPFRAMAFDVTRARMMAVGSELWEHDGTTWIPRDDQSPPVDGSAMVTDGARRRLVLVGVDTWEWDGAAWTLRSAGPGLGSGFGLAWDAARGRAVAFGGQRNGVLDETWEWDGSTWSRRSPSMSPPPRVEPAMAYDEARQRIVLFGGADSIGNPLPLSDTWEWDGTDWSPRTSAFAPAPRYRHAMAYDAVGRNIVLFGGMGRLSPLGDTWTWDGAVWTPLATAATPDPRSGHLMAFDPPRGRVLLMGGGPTPRSDVWEWSGSTWRELPQPAPDPRHGHAMAWDPVLEGVLCFGGTLPSGTPLADTWLWNGAEWRRQVTAHAPAARREHAMALDATRRRVVLFGGYRDSQTHFGDTWEWDGTDWLLRSVSGPSARYSTALAYDSARQRIVLFGGRYWVGGSEVPSDETWEWDGLAWTQRSPTVAPTARYSHAMAYDELRQRTVLLGGRGYSGSAGTDETWEYDGASWALRDRSIGIYEHQLAYDSVRQRVVLTGGRVTNASNKNACAYEWTGSSWTLTRCAVGRSDHSAAFDPLRGRVVVFSGGGNQTTNGDTAVYGAQARATASAIGTGCAGQTGTPRLVPVGLPVLGRSSFGLDVLDAHPGSLVLVPLALRQADIPFPGGCRVRVDPGTLLVTPYAIASSAGFTSVRVPVPPTPALSGLTLYAQALIAEPPTMRLVMTAGIRLGVAD